MKLRLGAHISVAKGLVAALEKAKKMGANTMQIFVSPPQSFARSKFSDGDVAIFKQKAIEWDIQPVFIHATYLINLASDDERLRRLSIRSLIEDLLLAKKIGALGSIVHIGSHKGKGFTSVISLVVNALQEVLASTPKTSKLILEIASGGQGKIGATLSELASILLEIKNSRLGISLDTAHMFAGGYAFDTIEIVDKLSQHIEQTVGWDRVWCMHVNDSQAEFGSGRDRHENLGQGKIGLSKLKILLNQKNFRRLPLILETPGFADKGPDQDNLEILKTLFI